VRQPQAGAIQPVKVRAATKRRRAPLPPCEAGPPRSRPMAMRAVIYQATPAHHRGPIISSPFARTSGQDQGAKRSATESPGRCFVVGGSKTPWIADLGSATKHLSASTRCSRPAIAGVAGIVPAVLGPLPHIAMDVVKTRGIRFEAVDVNRMLGQTIR